MVEDDYVDFRYILKSNYDVEISGTVTIPSNEDADDAEFEIVFDKEDGFTTPNLYIIHYGVDFLFFQRICDNIDINKIIELEDVYLVINGADFETIIRDGE